MMRFFRSLKDILFFLFYALIIGCALYACASIGNPDGGGYDEKPPQMVRSNPAPNTTRFDKNKIELIFDEFISIEKPSEKVIITPPQQKMPVIKSIGKKIVVELKDSTIPNTTYTFDFTNGIVDNNEKNAIEGFSFAVSTGDVVDSLMVSGLLLNAGDLEPVPNIMIGLHVNMDDSAFTSLPFIRTTSTNDRGQFKIRNVAPGTYKVYALGDLNRNYRFDPPNETLAFLDSLIVPSFEPAFRMDTIMLDSLTIDTIKEVHYTRFTPDDLVLHLFKKEMNVQYLSKTERPSDRQIIFHFNSDKDLPPTIRLLEDEENENENEPEQWFIEEYSPDKKDITYWITDSLVYKRDTLRLEANYLVDDSLYNPVPRVDTIRLIWKNKEDPKKKQKKEKEKEKEVIDFLKIGFSSKSVMDVFDTLKITFQEPIWDFDSSKIQMQQKVDTLWENRMFKFVQDTLNPRTFYVENTWMYKQEFRITIDSAAFFSVYGKWNDSIGTQFKLKEEEEYCNLYVEITGAESNGFGELLDAGEKVVRKSFLIDNELAFEDLLPGKYYLRYIEDVNENGVWDVGNYAEHRQPEKVYYFNKPLEYRKFQEDTENWNLQAVPIEKQKPLEITKNKPVEKKLRKNEQNRQQNSNRTNTNNSALPGRGDSNRSPQNLPGLR